MQPSSKVISKSLMLFCIPSDTLYQCAPLVIPSGKNSTDSGHGLPVFNMGCAILYTLVSIWKVTMSEMKEQWPDISLGEFATKLPPFRFTR